MARLFNFKKLTDLEKRVISALILIPLSLYIIYRGPPYSKALAAVGILILFSEWSLLCLKNHLGWFKKLFFIILGSFYIGVACLWIFQNMRIPDQWPILFWVLFLVWGTDVSAYFGGRFFRGPLLASTISPHKTWSGLFCGMFGGFFIAFVASQILHITVFSIPTMILFVFVAQMGDLLESKAKRWSGVKDSSLLIPGHGGLLDRLDSFLAVSFAISLWQIITY